MTIKASIRYTNFFIVYLLEFNAKADAGLEPVSSVYYKLGLYLPEKLPVAAHHIAVLIPGMDAAYDLVGVGTDRAAQAKIAMIVLSTENAGLVYRAHTPCAVIFPERVRADVPAVTALVPFEVYVPEELPSVVIGHLFLITGGQFQTVLI